MFKRVSVSLLFYLKGTKDERKENIDDGHCPMNRGRVCFVYQLFRFILWIT